MIFIPGKHHATDFADSSAQIDRKEKLIVDWERSNFNNSGNGTLLKYTEA
jgi:hypothetical protein